MHEEKDSATQKSSLEPKPRHSWDVLLYIHARERCSLSVGPMGGLEETHQIPGAELRASRWPPGGQWGACPPVLWSVCGLCLQLTFCQSWACPFFQNTAHTAHAWTLSWGGADLMPGLGPFLCTPTSPLLWDASSGYTSCFWSVSSTRLWAPREETLSWASWVSRA